MRPTLSVFTLSAVLVAITPMAVLNAPSVLAETPEWYTCPDSSAFKLRRDAEADALNAREHQPSAGAVTSADVAAHARLSAMSYDMYNAYSAGNDPLDGLAEHLEPIALIYGDPGRHERLGRSKARDTRTFYGVVADDPSLNRRVVILRGTLQPNEWIRNIQARLRPFLRSRIRRPFPSVAQQPIRSRALVHNGFMKIYESFEMTRVSDGARISFAEGLGDLIIGRDVTFIGHSLGAALATLAGVDTALMSPADGERIRIVTLASPRVGNKGFARLADAVGRIDRVCNLVDLVTAVPPSTRLTPYVHVGDVFRVSSFDWPQLENWHSKAGEQVTCWHSIFAYAYMTDPAKSTDGLSDVCLADQ
ncbi:MAG: lipase family protein [Planctomycetota bacterium]